MDNTTNTAWQQTSSERLPEEGRKVDWINSTGDQVDGGTRSGRLWFLPGGMYVYYTPTMWRYSLEAQ